MYCPKCGTQNADGSAYCSSCGTNMAQPQPVNPYYQNPYPPAYFQQKSAGLAAVLAFLIPGAGHLYAGKIMRGILFMAVIFGSIILIPLGTFYIVMSSSASGLDFIWFNVIFSIIIFVVWIYQIVDAYNSTQQYNKALMSTGRAPW